MTLDDFDNAFRDAVSDCESGARKPPFDEDTTLSWFWEVDGYSGGDCWGGRAHYYVSDDHEPNETPLDKFVQHIPSMTLVNYKTILRGISDYQFSQHEYYGNHSNYKGKYIERETLVNALTEMGYISG